MQDLLTSHHTFQIRGDKMLPIIDDTEMIWIAFIKRHTDINTGFT